MIRHAKKEHVDLFFVYGISVCLIISLSIVHHVVSKQVSKVVTVSTKQEVATSTYHFFDSSAFSDISIEGKAYIVYDLVDHTVIASKNESTPLPLASLTKLMTAVSSTLHKHTEEMIVVTPKSIDEGYDLGLKDKQMWKLNELLKYTLIFSSNDGAEVIADSFGSKDIFVNQMNTDAKILGLNLFFTNPAGLDEDGKIGGKGTVLEVAKLFGVARKVIPDVLDATTKKRQTVTASSGRISGVPNTNQSIENFPGAEASKTGYTDLAGGNLGVVIDVSLGHPVVIVVLGSTREGRFRDVETLYSALRKSITHN